MAVFNPAPPPTQDPNYLNYSRPTSQPMADESGKIMATGLGEALDTGVSTADRIVKKMIQDDVYTNVDRERDAFTQTLESVTSAKKENPSDLNVMPNTQGSSESVPPALNLIADKVGTLTSALGQGKINDTLYTQRLNSYATQMRAQYPGYRPYIDEQISAASGINPANAYMKNLLEDLNRDSTSLKTQRDKMITRAEDNIRMPNMPEMIELYKQGRVADYDMNVFLNKGLSYKYTLERYEAQHTIEKGERDNTAIASSAMGVTTANYMISNSLETALNTAGLGTQSLPKFIEQVGRGEVQVSPEQSRALAQLLSTSKAATRAAITNSWSVKGKDGLTEFDRMGGPDKGEAILNQQMKTYDAFEQLLVNKDFGAANVVKNANEDALDVNKQDLFNTKDLGPMLKNIDSLQKIGGPQYVGVLVKAILEGDVPKEVRSHLADRVIKLAAPVDIRTGKPQITLTQAIDETRSATDGMPATVAPKMYKEYLKAVQGIADPKTPDQVKSSLIKATFGPGNEQLITRFAKDYIDPLTKREVPGQYSVYSQLTNKAIVDQVWKASAKDPTLWKMTKAWAEDTFGGPLIAKDMKDLSEAQAAGIRVEWNDVSHQLEAVGANNAAHVRGARPLVRSGSAADTSVSRIIFHINLGLEGLSNIQSKEGGDTTAYLFGKMMELGFDPNKNVDGIPSKIMNALMAARYATEGSKASNPVKNPTTFEEAIKPQDYRKSNYAEEPKVNTLQDFLKNPGINSPAPKRGNISDEQFLGMKVDDIPEGMSARDFIKQLQNKK